jgi:ferredoxin
VTTSPHSDLRLVIDQDRCAGHGRCFSLEPDLFDSDDSGYAIAMGGVVSDELRDRARSAVANCPEAAISLTHS